MTRRVLNDNIDVPLKEGSFFVPSFVSLQGKSFNEREAENPGITRLNGGADMRVKVTLACTECKQRNYDTMKNKKNTPDRLEMNKYCRFCKKHTLHKETK